MSLSRETMTGIVQEITRLQDVVGYHFDNCLAYGDADAEWPCTCGMSLLREQRGRLRERLSSHAQES